MRSTIRTTKMALVSACIRAARATRALPSLLAVTVAVASSLPSAGATALEVPREPAGRVSDYANLLSAAAVARIEQTIASHEAQSSDQIAVAIFPSLDGENLEEFSIRLAERWQIGTGEHDNGAILLIFVEDRRARIEVGYGLEGRLTDALSSRILRQVLAPRFRQGDFDGGVEASVNAIIGIIQGEYTATGGKLPQEREGGGSGRLGSIITLIFFLVMFMGGPRLFWPLLLGSWMSGGSRGWRGGRRGGFGGFGGFGGGFGGFTGGGGGFGGGGASGRW